ncbi:MAG: hypothetical protein AAF990_07010 [Bacteroidota bacterium]
MNHRYEKRELAGAAPKADRLSSFSIHHESIMIGLLILFGVGGLAYIPMEPFGKDRGSHQLEYVAFESDNTFTNPTASEVQSTSTYSPTSHRQLLIEGDQKVGENLQFTIDNFDAQADYRLFIGENKWIPIRQKSFQYTFEQPGTYELLLKVSFESETAILHQEDLQIESDWLSSVGK